MSQSYKEQVEALWAIVEIPQNGGKSRPVDLITRPAALDIAAQADAALAAAREERDALRAECEALKKDAERYRLWRGEYTSADDDRSELLGAIANAWTPEAVDAVLDSGLAAIAGRAGEKAT